MSSFMFNFLLKVYKKNRLHQLQTLNFQRLLNEDLLCISGSVRIAEHS